MSNEQWHTEIAVLTERTWQLVIHRGDSIPAVVRADPATIRWLHSLEAEAASLREWKQAVIDAGVVNWTLSTEWENDPRRAIQDLIVMAGEIALDPTVSEEAAKLHAKARRWREALGIAKRVRAARHANNYGEWMEALKDLDKLTDLANEAVKEDAR